MVELSVIFSLIKQPLANLRTLFYGPMGRGLGEAARKKQKQNDLADIMGKHGNG